MLKWKNVTAGMLGVALSFTVHAEGDSALTQPEEIGFSVSKFVVVGELPFSDDEIQSMLSDFTGDHVGIEGLQAAGDVLESQLKKAGYAFIDISLPPQTLQDGVVTLEVVQSRIAEVVVKGRQVLSEENVRQAVPDLKEGFPLNSYKVSRSVGMANENPLKNLNVRFKGGERPGDIISTVEVKEGQHWNGFLGVSNTGTEQSGEFRTTLGVQYNNLFNKDHRAILAYTTSPEDPSTLSQYGLSYIAPFYASGITLSIFASHSDISFGLTDVPQSDGFINAAGTAYGAQVEKRLLNVGRVKQRFTVAVNNSLYENDTTILSTQNSADVRSTPITLGYHGDYSYKQTSVNWGLKYATNLEFGSDNDAAAYSLQDTNAAPGWSWVRYQFGVDKAFNKGWILRFNGRGQAASETLISGERFGIGGARSVRGYDERVLLGDSGFQLSSELWFPSLPWGKIRPLGFVDYGSATRKSGDLDNNDLSSAGIGLRWSKPEVASVSLDVGLPFDDIDESAAGQVKGDIKVHFNAYWRF